MKNVVRMTTKTGNKIYFENGVPEISTKPGKDWAGYVEFDVTEDLCPECFADTVVNRKPVHDPAKEAVMMSNKQARDDALAKSEKTYEARALIDSSKTEEQLTDLEKRIKYNIGTWTKQEVDDYVAANS